MWPHFRITQNPSMFSPRNMIRDYDYYSTWYKPCGHESDHTDWKYPWLDVDGQKGVWVTEIFHQKVELEKADMYTEQKQHFAISKKV